MKSFYVLFFMTCIVFSSSIYSNCPEPKFDETICYPAESLPWGISAEARIAYFHPFSKLVRRIYGDGWADYQLEFAKTFQGFGCLSEGCGCDSLQNVEWSLWTGVSGFSRNGRSIGFRDRTTMQLIPVSLGIKFYYPCFCNTKIFIGAAACYSMLRIHDHSVYVHEHVRKNSWGALLQSGIIYNFSKWFYASLFFDMYFQRFSFNDDSLSSFSSSRGFYGCSGSRYVERYDLNMDGYKVGLGIGFSF